MNTAPAHSPGYYVHFARVFHRSARRWRRNGHTESAEEQFQRVAEYLAQARAERPDQLSLGLTDAR